MSIACDERVASSSVVSALAALGARGCNFLPVSHRRADREWESRDLHKHETGRKILEAALAAGVPYPGLAFWRWIDQSSQQRLRERRRDELTGQYGRHPEPSWFQPAVTSAPLGVASPTRFGDGPFDDLLGTEVRPCPLGHVGGLNLLSELHIRQDSWDGSDICETAVATGLRRGLLRPARLLLVSQAVRRVLLRVKARGIAFEVARLE